jgi:hypothetical protein
VAQRLLDGLLRRLRRPGRRRPVRFRRYRPGGTAAPVTIVTPGDGCYIHTFFDVCPFSPSQRLLAVTRIPLRDRDARLGDLCDVCVVDLEGRTIETVYSTRAWGFQLGANLNWGATDRFLYTNDVIDGRAVCVRIDLASREARAFEGPMYHIAPDESCVVGFPLDLINVTQRGYGAPEGPGFEPLPPGASAVQGLWRTDLRSGDTRLLASIARLVEESGTVPRSPGGTFYLFHTKFNGFGSRIMQVLRYQESAAAGGRRRSTLLTLSADGSDVVTAIPEVTWARGGHHPSWQPDGEHLLMNLKLDGAELRFCEFRYDGSELRALSERHVGSGHPSIAPNRRFLVADAYAHDSVALGEGVVPIRLLDLRSDAIVELCSVATLGAGAELLRCDPHPAWSRDSRRVCFNGTPEGRRQVMIADLEGLTG